ncbi:MAG TPA: hypothetical protein VF426_12765 [Marmoricola sp.]
MISGPSVLRNRRLWIIAGPIVVVLVAAAVGFGLWHHAGNARVADVHTAWDLHCPRVLTQDHRGRIYVRSRPGWRCTVRLTVSNDSGHPVRVRDIPGDILGNEGGAEIRGYSTAQVRFAPKGEGSYRIETTIPAHATRAFRLGIGWRAKGCNSAGTLSMYDWPKLDITTTGRTFTVATHQTLRMRAYDDAHDAKACDLND